MCVHGGVCEHFEATSFNLKCYFSSLKIIGIIFNAFFKSVFIGGIEYVCI